LTTPRPVNADALQINSIADVADPHQMNEVDRPATVTQWFLEVIASKLGSPLYVTRR
jgi:hypothetical protein